MIRTYQYRLYPSKAQKEVMVAVLRSARFLYNHALAYRRKRWQESRQSVPYKELSGMWRDWRNEQPDDNPLRLLNMSAGQQVLRRLEKTYNAFFRGGGFPRFKGRDRFNSVDYVYGDGCKLIDNRLYIQNVGNLKVKLHRPLPENGVIKTVNLKRKASGWYVCFAVDLPDTHFLPNSTLFCWSSSSSRVFTSPKSTLRRYFGHHTKWNLRVKTEPELRLYRVSTIPLILAD